MQYKLKLNDFSLTLRLDCTFGDEEFLINDYVLVKILHTFDFTSVGGGIETQEFSKNVYSDFDLLYHDEIMEELNDNALEISKLYNEYKMERAVECR